MTDAWTPEPTETVQWTGEVGEAPVSGPEGAGTHGGSAGDGPEAEPLTGRSQEPAVMTSPAPQITVELYLLRHADAGDPMRWEGADEERPLSRRGRKQAKRLGRFLGALRFQPEVIVTSPKARAVETARIVGKRLRVDAVTNARLATDVGPSALERILDSTGGAGRVVLVGHDPDFSQLLALLCGCARVPMRKGALARIDLERPAAPGSGELRWLIPPDLLRD